jgi:hypothetical protein
MAHHGEEVGPSDDSTIDDNAGGRDRGFWLTVLVGLVAAGVVVALIVFGTPTDQRRTGGTSPDDPCGPDVNACMSVFHLVGVDGQMPTMEQFRETLAVNAWLVLSWQMRTTPLAYATMAATDDYADFTLFAGCVGGGQMTIEITSGKSFLGRMAVRCDGTIGLGWPVEVNAEVGKSGPTRLGPYRFQTASYGKVIDAEFFVMGVVPLGR